MITLDQVKLLEQKVESAVLKIKQLEAESDALRTRCLELTNALSSKTELLSTLQQERDLIESGILSALNNLDQLENNVISESTDSNEDSLNNSEQIIQNEQNQIDDLSNDSSIEELVISESENSSKENETTEEDNKNDFDSLSTITPNNNTQQNEDSIETQEEEPDNNNQDELGFDIF